MLENVYKTCLAYRLIKRGLVVETRKRFLLFLMKLRWSVVIALISLSKAV
jgi:hypothetical protein